MIKLITEKKDFLDSIGSLSDSHYRKNIVFLFECYGISCDFCEFYKTENAVFCIFEKKSALISGCPQDLEETAVFLNSVRHINCEYTTATKLLPYLKDFKNIPAYFEIAEITAKKSEDLTDECDLKQAYEIVVSGFGDTDFSLWYTDTSHKIRHNLSKCYIYKNAAFVNASFFGDDKVFLSQVSTLKTERHKGYATKMLHEVTGLFKGKTVYLIAEENRVSFYKSAGFITAAPAGRLTRKE